MPRLRRVSVSSSVVLFVASNSILSPRTTNGFMYAGIGPAIEPGTYDGHARQRRRHPEASPVPLGMKTLPERTENACCAELLKEENLVPRGRDKKVELPPSCLKEGAFCKAFDVHAPAPVPAVPSISTERTEENSCCADLLMEENLVPRGPDKTVQLPASCLEEGASCRTFGVYAPAPVPAVQSADIEESSTRDTIEASDPPAPVNSTIVTIATESDEQENYAEGSDFNMHDDGDDEGSKGPSVTHDEACDIDLLWSEADDMLFAEQLLTLPSLLREYGSTGYVRPRFSGVDKTIADDAEGETSPEKVLYSYDYYPMETSQTMTVVAPRSPVVLETNLIMIQFIVYGLNEETELRFLRALVGRNEEAASEDGYLVALETVNVVGSDIEIDVRKQTVAWEFNPMLPEAAHVVGPAIEIDVDTQQVISDYRVETSKAMTVVAPRAPVIPETNPITLRSTVYGLYEEPEVCLLRTLGRQNDEIIFDFPMETIKTMTVVDPRAPVIPETDLVTVRSTVHGLYEESEAASGDRHPTAIEAVHVATPGVQNGRDDQGFTAGRPSTAFEGTLVSVLAIDTDGKEEGATADRPSTACNDTLVKFPAIDTDGNEKVGEGYMWATEVIERAKGVQPKCAVESGSLNEVSQYVPARKSVAINVDDGRPRLAVKLVALLRRVRFWVNIFALIYGVVQLASLSYSATLSLRVDDKLGARVEYMAYWRRFIAVSVLRMRAKRAGDGKVHRALQVVLCVWIWQLWGTWLAYVLGTGLLIIKYVAWRPLHWRCAVDDLAKMVTFLLLCDYFAIKVVSEHGQALEELMNTQGTCLVAQFPLSIAAIAHDVLGVRRARTREERFGDFSEGVAVMKGNPDKLAVFESPDKSALTRQVVTMACEGQDAVVPIYVSGASRTYELLPGCDSKLMRGLARKIPGLVLRGVFGLVSYRQQLTVVLGRPVNVSQAPVTDDSCVAVEAAVLALATNNRPAWEKRESLFTRGPIGWG